jgi:hypothetical protein
MAPSPVQKFRNHGKLSILVSNYFENKTEMRGLMLVHTHELCITSHSQSFSLL